jgi:hypothetical protein
MIEDVITRVRRGTRSADVLTLCDEVERLKKALATASVGKVKKTADKKAYMRRYMAQYRKKGGTK